MVSAWGVVSDSPSIDLGLLFIHSPHAIASKRSTLNEKRAPSANTRGGRNKANTARFRGSSETAKNFHGEHALTHVRPRRPAHTTPSLGRRNEKNFLLRTTRAYTCLGRTQPLTTARTSFKIPARRGRLSHRKRRRKAR